MSTVVESTGKSPVKIEVGVKLRGAEKFARIPVKIIPTDEFPRKPDWIRVRIPWFAEEGARMGFKNVASGPLVRSSYHADQQLHGSEAGLKPS